VTTDRQCAVRSNLGGWLGLVAWSACLVLLVYGSALHLPLMADDFFQFPFIDQHSLAQIWQTAEGLYYFRPLAFTIWKIVDQLFGYHNPAAQHALNLLLHVLKGLLVAWLADRLWCTPNPAAPPSDWPRRFLAATLFLLYPFSYEAVPWIAAMMHLLVTTLILGSVVAYLKMRSGHGRAWGFFSLLLAFLSPFAHENGAMVAPLIVVVEITRPLPLKEPRRLAVAAAWFLPVLAWWLLWRQVPAAIEAGGLVPNNGRELWANTVYVAQGAAYPLTWLSGPLRDRMAGNGLTLTAGLSLLAFGLVAFTRWWRGADQRSWLPWLWIGLAMLPGVLFLPFDYLGAAPRLLMLASAAIAWLWADFFWVLATPAATSRRATLLLASALGVALLWQNLVFIGQQMKLYQLGGSVIWQSVATTKRANEANQTAVFINLPVWFAPPQATFAAGQEGVIFMPAADNLEALVSVHTGRPARLVAVRWDEIRTVTPYHTGLIGEAPNWTELATAGPQLFVTRYTADEITIEPAGSISPAITGGPPLATFDGTISLRAATAQRDGDQVRVSLWWQLSAPVSAEITVFVHALDANGQLIGQADGDPLVGIYPFWRWPPGQLIQDERSLPANPLPASFRIGLYNWVSGERLPSESAAGQPWADDAVLIPLTP
jgi:hypothetical protein